MDEPRTFEKTDIPAHLLQHELIDVLQTGMQVKQAQWSLPNQDSALATTLSELSRSCLAWADEIASSMAGLRVPPDGRVKTVAASPTMLSLEPRWRTEQEVAQMAGNRCTTFATWAQERAEDPTLANEATKALFSRIARGLRDYSAQTKEWT